MPDEKTNYRLKTLLSILIALAATTGALVSWHASRVGSQASGADGAAIAAALADARTEMDIASSSYNLERNAREFQYRRDSAAAIREEAKRRPEILNRLADDLQEELAQVYVRAYQLVFDFTKAEEGRYAFERERFYKTNRAAAESAEPLESAPFIARSAERRLESARLVSLNALFTAAIFFFTVSLKTDFRRKLPWTAAGLVSYLAGAGMAFWRILL
jgi:hypothetical protein